MQAKGHLDRKNRAGGFAVCSVFIFTLALCVLFAALPLAGANSGLNGGQDTDKKHENNSIGFILSKDANAKDVGLPLYPGSHRSADTSDDTAALQMGLWGHSSGFKLVVLKLDSNDSPEKIARFYRKALGRYGHVLDCSSTASQPGKIKTDDESNALSCESDHAGDGGFVFKAGTKEKQHVVDVEPNEKQSQISLVYVQSPVSDDEQN